jgi:ArsR family transcriptional regulator
MDVSETLKALGDETRLRILNLLSGRELCVCLIKEALGLLQPNVSKHLSRLKSSGIIRCRKISQWCFFRINDVFINECKELCEFLQGEWATERIYIEDIKRLEYLMATNDCCEQLLQKVRCQKVAITQRK